MNSTNSRNEPPTSSHVLSNQSRSGQEGTGDTIGHTTHTGIIAGQEGNGGHEGSRGGRGGTNRLGTGGGPEGVAAFTSHYEGVKAQRVGQGLPGRAARGAWKPTPSLTTGMEGRQAEAAL